MPLPRHALRIALALLCTLVLTGFNLLPTDLRTQRELSDVAGTFAPSRYLTYEGSDVSHHHFRERGKFGPLGPSGHYRIARKLIELEPMAVGSVLTYDQNSGTFLLEDLRAGRRQSIKADFKETHTAEEERYLKAGERLAKARQAGDGDALRKATVEAMFASYGTGRLDETLRHADSVIELRDWHYAHAAHLVAGSIALTRNDRGEARARLLAAAQVRPSAVMQSFGPNMGLAQKLLEAGETDVVLEYLERCKAFWKPTVLEDWQAQIRQGKTPGFGANLNYGMR